MLRTMRVRAFYGEAIWALLALLLCLLALWPPVMGVLVDQLDELGDTLGRDHDLAVLADAVRDQTGQLAGLDEAAAQVLLRHIARRRSELQASCQVLGQRLYAERPGALVQRLATYWYAWEEEQAQTVVRPPPRRHLRPRSNRRETPWNPS